MSASLEQIEVKIDQLIDDNNDVVDKVDRIDSKVDEIDTRLVRVETSVEKNAENTKNIFALVQDKVNVVENKVDNQPEQMRGYIHKAAMIVFGVVGAIVGIITLMANMK